MAQPLANIHIHLVYSTRDRQRIISDTVREPLHVYSATVLKAHRCHPVLINSLEDDIHLLFDLGRMVAVSKAIAEVKVASSQWIKTQAADYSQFCWQVGYGAFAVDASNIEAVRSYIGGQSDNPRSRRSEGDYEFGARSEFGARFVDARVKTNPRALKGRDMVARGR